MSVPHTGRSPGVNRESEKRRAKSFRPRGSLSERGLYYPEIDSHLENIFLKNLVLHLFVSYWPGSRIDVGEGRPGYCTGLAVLLYESVQEIFFHGLPYISIGVQLSLSYWFHWIKYFDSCSILYKFL